MKETFTYDDMNRLTGITLSRPAGQDLACAVTYDALGRMTSKQAVTAVNGVAQVSAVFSQPVFNATKVHAVSSAQSMSDMFPTGTQNVTYTSFDKANKIKLGMDSICYTYGYDQQRIGMEEYLGSSVRTKQYVGSCEYITETGTSGTKTLTYLTGPYGVFAVVERQNNAETLHYILKDNLGSWTTITNGNGAVEQRLSFDAWGNQRNPNTWANYTANDTYSKPMFDRGFTGHEHLTAFGLINMNGRMYDPVMSSFLSADRYVQDPSSAQGFNRYAYCMYNPLRFVDPTGWLPGSMGSGYPRTVSGLIQDYLSDPCYITRSQLREAGIYNIEGGYGYAGGTGTMTAYWMDGCGGSHSSTWGVNTESSGFEVGAWAIPASFNSNWVNDCLGYCNYGGVGVDNFTTGTNAIACYYSFSGRGGGKSGTHQNIKPAVTALTTMWTASVVEPTPIGEAISIVATGAAALYYGEELIAKMKKEISHLLTRPDGPDGFVHELRTNTSGYYPCVRTSTLVYMEAGEVWKIGETTQGNNRYTDNWYQTYNVHMISVFEGNQREIKIHEKILIYQYYFKNGHLPPGNRIFR